MDKDNGERFDIILFGASGHTGKHCIPYLATFGRSDGRNLTWAVAGRSIKRLEDTLVEMGQLHGKNFATISIIEADINDYESLVKMASKAKLVINCCGPYRFYGDPVVLACIEAGTHHVDVSGEPEYMERIQVDHHSEAVKKGVYIISACGLDSIPVDLGVIYMQQQFKGTINSVETYMSSWNEGEVSGPRINYGTWESAVHSVANIGEMKKIRKRFFEKYNKPPILPPQLKMKRLPHKPGIVDGWALPFLGSDRSVSRRSQGYLYENEKFRPAQVGTYFIVDSLFDVLGILILASIFFVLCKFETGKKWLLDYPELFSCGFFSKRPPSTKTSENIWFSIDFSAKGWKAKAASKDEQYSSPPDTHLMARVKARNPGYGATCIAVVFAAIVVLTEKEKLANNGKGGIFPPGAAFAKTSLVNHLKKNGFQFTMLSDNVPVD